MTRRSDKAGSGDIDRSDLESKFREIESEVGGTAEAAKPAGIAVGGAIAAGAVGLAYIFGQRKARKQTTVVEVRRV